MSFVCRFRLTECAPSAQLVTGEQNEEGRWVQLEQPRKETVVRVRFSPVQGGAFGKATPMGDLTMTIANPIVASHLAQVWTDYCNDPNQTVAPTFDVTFAEAK